MNCSTISKEIFSVFILWLRPASVTITVCFVILIYRYKDRLLPLLRQFLLIPNRINKWKDLRANRSTSCCNKCCSDLFIFSSSSAISNSKALDSGTRGSVVCLAVCLTSLAPCTVRSWWKCFLHKAKILWESAIKSLFLLFSIVFLDW